MSPPALSPPITVVVVAPLPIRGSVEEEQRQTGKRMEERERRRRGNMKEGMGE
jgi:hypothetical protein